ncbi:MAG: AarF/ABC1/UbiB kinase family protein [Moraxella sp.]|nr:AarF/ABC1/UbiB kinase family protein [Moraxella sp.]
MSEPIDKLKTSALSRRLSIAKTSLNIGKNIAKHSVTSLFVSSSERQAQKQAMMTEQAQYLAQELGKLKGSVVKIGQMLALYGEGMLPKEIVSALHTLDAQTTQLSFGAIHQAIYQQLGDKINDFDIDPAPIGTASLAQVHQATLKSTGQQVVLKVQYPDVAKAIDSDLSLFKHLLKVTNAVPQTRILDAWFEEIRALLHTEVDYHLEAATTERFFERLATDLRYVVPKIYPDYSTKHLLCMSFEAGIKLTDPILSTLSQDRRNALGQMAMDIVMRELFDWAEMQTDPNFGNYLVRLGDKESGQEDKLVLLDFGAIKRFDDTLIHIAQNLLSAGYHQDKALMQSAMTGYDFFYTMSDKVKADVADVFLLASEPFANPAILSKNPIGKAYLDTNGRYHWAGSDLYNRAMSSAKERIQSREFTLPPKEMMFISRKFIGAYALLCALDARTDAELLVKPFLSA